jgi:CheY-like chemotaxis protein
MMMELSPGYRDSSTPAVVHGDVVGGTYTILNEIARTETGTVFEARDVMLGRLVALKLGWREPEMPSMILEARRCAAVRDPCAVAIYGMGQHLGIEYVVGERISGVLLRQLLDIPLSAEMYLSKLRTLTAAVVHAHECGIAIGEISGATISAGEDGRLVLGRLSLSQIPAFGPLGQIRAPEVVRGVVAATDPAGAEAIDLYGLGCIAIELARGAPPFSDESREVELRGHAQEPPPRLADIRTDLPVDLSDLVEWLLAKQPAARPPSAKEVLAQVDAIVQRVGTTSRTIRVLIVDDDTARARWLWSLARRAYSAALVEIASEGTDAAHKLNRDHPDLVFIDSSLRGVMNALELCMYARGLEVEHAAQLVVIGAVTPRDRSMFAEGVQFIPDDANLAMTIIDRVRTCATTPLRRRKPRTTVSG